MSRTSYLSTEDERMLTLACIAPSSAEPQPKERSSVEAKDVRRLSGSFALPSDVSWLVMGRAIRQGGEPHSHPPGPLMSDALKVIFALRNPPEKQRISEIAGQIP